MSKPDTWQPLGSAVNRIVERLEREIEAKAKSAAAKTKDARVTAQESAAGAPPS